MRTRRLTRSPDRPCTWRVSAESKTSIPSVLKTWQDRVRDIRVLTTGELRTVLDDGDAAPEATVRLRELEADIAAPEHDQVRGQPIELQRLDMREGLGSSQARDFGMVACVPTLRNTRSPASTRVPPSFNLHLEGFRRDEMPRAHDQLGATRLVVLQVHGDQPLDHVALALPHARHLDRPWTGHHPELGRVAHQIGDFGAPDLVFARETVDVRARAADPLAFHDGRPMPGVGHVPRQIFAPLATAEDENVNPFRLSHDHLLAGAVFEMPEQPCGLTIAWSRLFQYRPPSPRRRVLASEYDPFTSYRPSCWAASTSPARPWRVGEPNARVFERLGACQRRHS